MTHNKGDLKLTYFDGRGRAEASRLTLVAAGVNFEDVRIPFEKWALEKPNTPFGQVPVLEVNGETFDQSIAIATYCARQYGLHGKTNLDALKIDQIVQLGVDFMNFGVKIHFENDETKKAELVKHFKEVEAPKYLGFYETLLEKSGTGFFVGSSLTLADIFTYDRLYSYSQQKPINLTTDGYLKVSGLVKTVESHPKISSYLATRKETIF